MLSTLVDIAVGVNTALPGCRAVLHVSLRFLSKLFTDGIFQTVVGNSFMYRSHLNHVALQDVIFLTKYRHYL